MWNRWRKTTLSLMAVFILFVQSAAPVAACQSSYENNIAIPSAEQAASGRIGAETAKKAERPAIEEAPSLNGTENTDETEAAVPEEPGRARDEELFGRYYRSLTGFDVPEIPKTKHSRDAEEVVGANTPAYYRTQRLTPVRDQGESNLCWAFSTTALLETSLLLQYPDENASTLDLSEEQLAYFYFNRQNDPLGNTGDMKMVCEAFDGKYAYRYASGSPIYMLQELSTGQGITTEAQVPFYLTRIIGQNGDVAYVESDAVPDTRSAYLSYANITGYELFDYDVDKVKQEIMENGAVSVSMYYDNSSRNLRTNAYYSPENRRTNHIVTLVGWNDTYKNTNFNADSRPNGDGAFIVRNSWGDDWGDNGYFYISYENATMLACVSTRAVRTAEKSYPNLYFYDGLSMVGNSCVISPLSASGYMSVTAGANVFEVKAGNGRGEAIGEVTLCTWTRDAVYRVSIYTDLLDTNDPTSGRLSLVETVQMEGSGLCAFRLSHEVEVSAGSWYSVVVENVGTKYESFSAQRMQKINDVLFVTDNLYCRSLTRNKEGVWTDMAENGDGEVLRIRAATRTLSKRVKPKKVFTDVLDPDHAYYWAIYWAADKGITGGYQDGTFGIDRTCTRGEAIMFLWRFAGKPEPARSPRLTFSDVPKSDPFYKAILWAYQQGITKGYSDGTFGKNLTCTRGHIMMFIWKYLERPTPRAVAKSPFEDVPKSHTYYRAILYGYQQNITKGFKDGTFGVNVDCTRGQIVRFLYNMR